MKKTIIAIILVLGINACSIQTSKNPSAEEQQQHAKEAFEQLDINTK